MSRPTNKRKCCACKNPLARYSYGPNKQYVRAYPLPKLGKRPSYLCHACYLRRQRHASKPYISKLRHAHQVRAAKAYALRLQGRSYAQIAQHFKASPRQIHRWMQAHERLVIEKAGK